MKDTIFDERNGLWYERCGDYYLPSLYAPESKPVGVWGQRYQDHMRKHQRAIYTSMWVNGTLDDHIAEVDQQAQEMFDLLMRQYAELEGVTEQLKATNQMEWVRRMNGIRNRVEEVVLSELIFA